MSRTLALGLYYISCVFQIASVLSYHVDSQHVVDLLQYVVIENSGFPGHPNSLITTPGANNHSTAYVFTGSTRRVELAPEAVSSLQAFLKTHHEFSIIAQLRQEQNNSGSILTFTVNNQRYLELESSGRRDEIRVHYHHRTTSHQAVHTPHIQSFSYHLADGNWHRVALSVSSHYLQLFIDCQRVYSRQVESLDTSYIANQRLTRVWLGQRHETQGHFKGAIEYVKVVLHPEGHLVQCPQGDIPCPTCSQYYKLENNVQELFKVIEKLNEKLSQTEERVRQLEQCECRRSCDVDGNRYRDGETWQPDHCSTCTCRAGEVVCRPPICPPTKCMHPVQEEGECCPKCLTVSSVPILRTLFTAPAPEVEKGEHCYYGSKKYDHLEEYYPRECIKCTCLNGHLTCHKEDNCPVLNCAPEHQVAVEGQCCKFCKGLDYCSMGHDCHVNATCYNLDTKYTCQCNHGYTGDGKNCTDVDECASVGGLHGHHCHANTICVNTPGAYTCECLLGYIRETHFSCRELNECHLGLHDCDDNAVCINTEGAFVCECAPGYHGDGHDCQPTCDSPCRHGGTCIAPNVCSCRHGYLGGHCQLDLDECAKGLSQCHHNSECINIPGSYYCKCKAGFHSNHYDNLNGLLCRDVNECYGWGGGHSCPRGTECMNKPGGYECACRYPGQCPVDCQLDGEFHANGSVWNGDACQQCYCKNGEVRCSRKECDCSTDQADAQCCPHCSTATRCQHQELPITYNSGDTWIYQCQMCECLLGEVDCWALQCPLLSCSKVIHEDGDCCPRCIDKDPCFTSFQTAESDKPSGMSTVCFFDGRKYTSGQTWVVTWDVCSSCSCQVGQICCTYNETCSRGRQDRLGAAHRLAELIEDDTDERFRQHRESARSMEQPQEEWQDSHAEDNYDMDEYENSGLRGTSQEDPVDDNKGRIPFGISNIPVQASSRDRIQTPGNTARNRKHVDETGAEQGRREDSNLDTRISQLPKVSPNLDTVRAILSQDSRTRTLSKQERRALRKLRSRLRARESLPHSRKDSAVPRSEGKQDEVRRASSREWADDSSKLRRQSFDGGG